MRGPNWFLCWMLSINFHTNKSLMICFVLCREENVDVDSGRWLGVGRDSDSGCHGDGAMGNSSEKSIESHAVI